MGARADKGKRVTKYLGAASGFPFFQYEGATARILSPAPYNFKIVTANSNDLLWKTVKALPETGINGIVRYDAYIESVDKAVMCIPLASFAPLLEAHYLSIQDRIKGE